MSRRNIEQHHGGYIIGGELIQVGYDFPAAAESVGWSLRRVQWRGADGEWRHLARIGRAKGDCEHRGTDGTVSCPDCGISAGAFISAAAEYLDRFAF